MATDRPSGGRKSHAFGREVVALEDVLAKVTHALGTSPTSISGECCEPKKTGRDWRFDLADIQNGKLQVLPARINVWNAPRVSRYLRSRGTSIEHALQAGNSLELDATVTLDSRKKLILEVTKIAPHFSRTGRIYVRNQTTKEQLASAGVPALRLDRDRIHVPPAGARTLLPAKLHRVLVIGSEKSQGLADFKESVARSQTGGDLDIEYQTVTWSRSDAARNLEAILGNCEVDAYDLAVLVRGGGHWSELDVFNDPAVALAVRNCAVPIATAVGHATDVLMADRAANFSFTTPTAAGEAIRREAARRSIAGQAGQPARSSELAALLDAKRRRYEIELQEREAALQASRRKLDESRVELSKSQQTVGYYADQLRTSAAVHTEDLIFLALRRVRILSMAWFPVTLGALLAYLASIPSALESLGAGSNTLARTGLSLAGLLAGAALFRTIHRCRQAMSLPAGKPMKNPPASFNEWRHMARNVRTIRGLRRTIRHRPW